MVELYKDFRFPGHYGGKSLKMDFLFRIPLHFKGF